jgi:hypothetical protein
MFSEPLPRNSIGTSAYLTVAAQEERLCMLHCSLLKAIHPKWPIGILPFIIFQGLYLVSPSSLWLGFHGVYSPTASTAPSLRPLVPSDSHTGCHSVQMYYHQLSFPHHDTQQDANNKVPPLCRCRWTRLEWLVLLHLQLLLCMQSLLSFRREPTPPQCPVTHFSNPDRRLNRLLHNLQPDGFPEDPSGCPLLPQT